MSLAGTSRLGSGLCKRSPSSGWLWRSFSSPWHRRCKRRGRARKQLRRSQVLTFFEGLSPCLVGNEACASAHHWGRQLKAVGHEVRLMPPAYVKAYVERGKTDAADAEAIAEAVTRPRRSMPMNAHWSSTPTTRSRCSISGARIGIVGTGRRRPRSGQPRVSAFQKMTMLLEYGRSFRKAKTGRIHFASNISYWK